MPSRPPHLKVIKILLFTFLATNPFVLEARDATVLDIKGNVKYWQAWGVGWKSLEKDDVIPINSIVIIGEDSLLKYSPNDPSLGFDEITVSRPIAFRIDGNEVRQINVRKNFVAEIPDLEGLVIPSGVGSKKSTGNISNAWNKVVVMASKPFKSTKSAPSSDSNLKGQVNTSLITDENDDVKMIYPSQPTITTIAFPYNMKVRWKAKKELKENALYELWLKKGDQPEKLITRTTSKHYNVKLNEYGSYSVEVRIKEKERTTRALLKKVQLKSPRSNIDKTASTDSDKQAISSPGGLIKRLSPPSGLTFKTLKFPYRMHFSWQFTRKPNDHQITEFVISDDNGREVSRKKILGRDAFHVFNQVGKYKWHLETGLSKSQGITKSRIFSLNIVGNNLSFNNFKGGTLYLENGLNDL